MTEERFTLERLERKPIVSIRARVPLAEAPAHFDRSYSALFSHVAANGGRMDGAPLSLTHEVTEDHLDVEVAVPLEESIPGDGEIVSGEIQPVEAAVTYHVGSYAKLSETYDELADFVRDSGRETTGVGYEFYVDNPTDVPVERCRTRIALPLKEK